MDPQVNIVSSQAAHRGDNKPLAAMLDQLVDPASPPPPDEPQHPARTASSTYAPPAAGPRATDPGPARRFRDRVEVTDLAAGKARHASPERGTHWWKRRRDPMRRVGDSSQMKLRGGHRPLWLGASGCPGEAGGGGAGVALAATGEVATSPVAARRRRVFALHHKHTTAELTVAAERVPGPSRPGTNADESESRTSDTTPARDNARLPGRRIHSACAAGGRVSRREWVPLARTVY
jgi:hypothetical protein